MPTQRIQEYDAEGNLVRETDVDIPQESVNSDLIVDRLNVGIARLEAVTTKAAWGALTANQRWVVVRVALALLAKFMRLHLNRLDSAGVDDTD